MLIIYPRQGPSFGANIIDYGYAPTGKFIASNWAQYHVLRNNMIDYNIPDNINFTVGMWGGAGFTPSTGPLILVMNGSSQTVGTVLTYDDGKINIPSFSVNSIDPVVAACQGILNENYLQTTNAGTYKLAVQQNNVTVFTVRSVKWGSIADIEPPIGNYQVIDNQTLNTDNPPV